MEVLVKYLPSLAFSAGITLSLFLGPALIGSLLGLFGGLIYTKCALSGLNGVWSGATVGLKLTQSFQPLTLAIAFASSLIVSALPTPTHHDRELFLG